MEAGHTLPRVLIGDKRGQEIAVIGTRRLRKSNPTDWI